MPNDTNRTDLSALLPFDTDGALEETAADAARHSRRSFVRTSGLAIAGAAVAGGLVPGAALALSAAMDLIVYTTSIVPNNRLPGTTPFYIAWSLVLHGVWGLYLLRSRRVRRTFR